MIKYRLKDLPRWLQDFVPLLLFMALIFYLSSQSRLVEIEGEVEEKLFFKIAHVLAYAVLAWLWWRALSPQRYVTWQNLAAACGLAVLYGISDELHQLYVPGRHSRLADVFFDTTGALFMIILLRRFSRVRAFPDNVPIWFTSGDTGSQSEWEQI